MDFPSEIVEDLEFAKLAPIEVADLSIEEAAQLPTWWAAVLALPEQERIARAITEWNGAVPNRFPKLLAHLAQTGTGVYLARDRHTQLNLLYAARDADNERPICWAGSMPLAGDDPAIRPALPTEVIKFHTAIHDKFWLADGWHNGWLPMRDMFALSENFDVNDEEIEFYETPVDFNPRELDLDQVIAVFVGSSRGFAVDTANRANPDGGWYWFEGSLEPITNFWEDIDENILNATR